MVFAAHDLICENGTLLSEAKPFGAWYACTELDLGRMVSERCRSTTFRLENTGYATVAFHLPLKEVPLTRHVSPTPFVPADDAARAERCELILAMQADGLAKRIAHVKGTEEEAVRLARRWGADEEHARRAAILHDCTKYLELDEQLQLCAKYGIVLDELEQQAVKLLHSKTGACVARHVYGVSDDIYEAIFWHTTGKAGMTLLEKLLYVADYMEPTRDFPGVERLRALAYEDLDAAVLLGCEMSIQEMAERGLPVHPNTVKARDWLRSKTKGTSD